MQTQYRELAPKTDEVRRYIMQVEQRYPDTLTLDQQI
jgi:hypothetical protein